MRALRNVLTNLSEATTAVPEGRPSKDCDNLHASAAVPATPQESMAASRKRTGSEREADLERKKKRIDLEPDSDVDVIVSLIRDVAAAKLC